MGRGVAMNFSWDVEVVAVGIVVTFAAYVVVAFFLLPLFVWCTHKVMGKK